VQHSLQLFKGVRQILSPFSFVLIFACTCDFKIIAGTNNKRQGLLADATCRFIGKRKLKPQQAFS
jgi:hypothetical protein